MISCVSPSNHSANHTINTLRYSMRLKEKMPNNGNNKNNMNVMSNNNNYMEQMKFKKRIIPNKNNKISRSPNIKKNYPNKPNNFRLIDKHDNNNYLNSYHTNTKYNIEMNQNKIKQTANSNKNISLNAKKITKKKFNLNGQRSPNIKNTAFNSNFKKLNSNKNKEMQNIKIVNNTKRLKTHKYSTLVENKKKQLNRTQSDSNKLKNLSNTNSDKIKIVNINKTALYKNTNTYQQNIPAYVVHKNIDLNIDIDPRQEYEDLVTDHIEEMCSQEKYLTEDDLLIHKVKGLTKDNQAKQIYKPVIENIIESKMNYLNKLQNNIIEYKKLLHKYK